jgi:hypothetical protein
MMVPMAHAILLLVVASLLPGGPRAAHHSISGIYDTRREVTIEAVVAEFHWVNPHPFLVVAANGEGEGQEVATWRLEMDNRGELSREGMSGETFRQDDRVTVTGNPGREDARTLYIRRLDRPADGLRYEQIGTSPRVEGLGAGSRSRRFR